MKKQEDDKPQPIMEIKDGRIYRVRDLVEALQKVDQDLPVIQEMFSDYVGLLAPEVVSVLRLGGNWTRFYRSQWDEGKIPRGALKKVLVIKGN